MSCWPFSNTRDLFYSDGHLLDSLCRYIKLINMRVINVKAIHEWVAWMSANYIRRSAELRNIFALSSMGVFSSIKKRSGFASVRSDRSSLLPLMQGQWWHNSTFLNITLLIKFSSQLEIIYFLTTAELSLKKSLWKFKKKIQEICVKSL